MTRLLVIEDDHLTRRNIVEGLSYAGYEALQAPNGTLGVALARQENPDLIICDINMPDISGYDVLLQLREDSATAHIPFIFLTAFGDRDAMREGMRLGADDYIPKPFQQHELIEAVQMRLQKQASIADTYNSRIELLRNNIVQAVPHELRTPLLGIIGYGEMLVMDSGNMSAEEIAEMAHEIVRSGWRLHRAIENYLIYAQVELMVNNPEQRDAARKEIEHHPLAYISGTADAMRERHHRIINMQRGGNGAVYCNSENLTKILNELMDNAIKFSDADTPITIETRLQDGMYIIAITNHGRGMTREQVQAVGAYMQFERALYEQQGLGLGLIIARRLIELHGGTLTIHSTPGETTTATIALRQVES